MIRRTWSFGLISGLFFINYQPTAINQKPNTMRMYFIGLLKVFIDKINNRKNHPLKMNIALYCHFLKLKRCLELICSFHNKAKNKFILLRILKKQSIAQLLRCGNVYHDVTGFELCGSHNIQLSKYLENETLIFLQRENSFLIIILCPQ